MRIYTSFSRSSYKSSRETTLLFCIPKSFLYITMSFSFFSNCFIRQYMNCKETSGWRSGGHSGGTNEVSDEESRILNFFYHSGLDPESRLLFFNRSFEGNVFPRFKRPTWRNACQGKERAKNAQGDKGRDVSGRPFYKD